MGIGRLFGPVERLPEVCFGIGVVTGVEGDQAAQLEEPLTFGFVEFGGMDFGGGEGGGGGGDLTGVGAGLAEEDVG